MTQNLDVLFRAATKAVDKYFDLLLGNYELQDDGSYRYMWIDESAKEKAEMDRMIDELNKKMEKKLQEYEDACNAAGVEPRDVLDLDNR